MDLIFCTFRVAGFHHWPDAPKKYAYLGTKHRHEFHFRVELYVTDDNREVEFIEFKEIARDVAMSGLPQESGMVDFGGASCERIARDLGYELMLRKYAVHAVEVSEDGENGARIEWPMQNSRA